MTARNVYLEIGPDFLKALVGDQGWERPLERQENRRLHPAQVEKLAASLREFLQQNGVRPDQRAFCAISARGVSLRRMTLPAATKDELQRLLLLQIEREFPLAPDDLAWGYRLLGEGAGKTQELLVMAVKREVLQEYSDLLVASGVRPEFTLGVLARSALVDRLPASCAMLDLGRSEAELISFERGTAGSIRVLPWSGAAGTAEVGALAKSIQTAGVGQRLYLSGAGARLKDLAPQLTTALGVECESLEDAGATGRSTSILGLKKSCEEGGAPLIWLRLQSARETEITARPAPIRKWAALAGLLILVSFSLRYAEAFVQRPRLAQRIAEIKKYRDKLPQVDRELGFLQYLKTNQPPYLEPIFAMANAAPGGARLESLSLNRRGDLALRASLGNSQQVGDFRTKLIQSGLFTTVVVEEQVPTPDKQKVLVRVTGQWKPLTDGKSVAGELLRLEKEKARSQSSSLKPPASTNAAMPSPTMTNPPASRTELKE